MSFKGKIIFIADSHLGEGEEENRLFFRMLERFRQDPPSALVFLGDVFELWIALPGYETLPQKDFLSFCREMKEKFPIYFVEGNHEFFVASSHKKDFTFVHPGKLALGEKCLLIHGDSVNKADWKYASLRILARNAVSRFLLRLFSLTWGVEAVHKIRVLLKPSNKAYKGRFPKAEFAARLEEFARKKPGMTLFTGHFHTQNYLESSGMKVYTIPAWDKEKALAGVWDEEKETLEILSLAERK